MRKQHRLYAFISSTHITKFNTMSNFSFSNDGDHFVLVDDNNTVVPKLPVGIYNMCHNDKDGVYLECIGNKFSLPFEHPNYDEDFIAHVIKSYGETNMNMSVMLNDTNGTCKICTAKTIANELNLPVIIIGKMIDHMKEFIKKIQDSCCFFFDEFEEMCEHHNSDPSKTLQSVLDGVKPGETKHVLIMTSKNMELDSSSLSRLGNLLYYKLDVQFP